MQSTKKRQRKYDPGMWESAAVHIVAQLHEGIDGLLVYNITNISDGQVKGQHSLEGNGRKAVSLNGKTMVLCDILTVMDRINTQTRHLEPNMEL